MASYYGSDTETDPKVIVLSRGELASEDERLRRELDVLVLQGLLTDSDKSRFLDLLMTGLP